jgi:hypothetical protein
MVWHRREEHLSRMLDLTVAGYRRKRQVCISADPASQVRSLHLHLLPERQNSLIERRHEPLTLECFCCRGTPIRQCRTRRPSLELGVRLECLQVCE